MILFLSQTEYMWVPTYKKIYIHIQRGHEHTYNIELDLFCSFFILIFF